MYLEKFKSIVIRENDIYRVHYFNGAYTGECIYKLVEMGGQKKPIKQKVLLLTETEMGDVIEGIHKLRSLNENDFKELDREIREHSRMMVNEFIS